MKTGIELIADERARQIGSERFTAANDDIYLHGELAAAGACYASTAVIQSEKDIQQLPPCFIHKDWPWARVWWKPSNDRKRNLIKAGALIAADLDRILREEARAAQKGN